MADDQTNPCTPKFDYFLATSYCPSDFAVNLGEELLERECPKRYVHSHETLLGSRFQVSGKASQTSVYISANDEVVAVTDLRAVRVDMEEIRAALERVELQFRS